MRNSVEKISPTIGFASIAKFLKPGSRLSRLPAYFGLGVGVFLLLCCVQMFINLNGLLHEKNSHKNGYDYLPLTKNITNENMGRDNRFSAADIAELKHQPFITDAAALESNEFRAKASAGDVIPFSTDLFIEAVNDNFIDTLPPSFAWQPGQQQVPVIFSADFLEMYNVFAPAQGLPQISPETIGAVNMQLECYDAAGNVHSFRGHVVALSDRINSVLVPQSFLEWANATFSGKAPQAAARVFIKTTDANNPVLQEFLTAHGYHVNREKTKFGRLKSTLQAVISGLAGLAGLVVLLSVLLFSFYLKLMISKSRDNLRLLILLGYSPLWLTKTVARNRLPVYATMIATALAGTAVLQYFFSVNFHSTDGNLPVLPSVFVLLLSVVLFSLCAVANFRLLRNQLFQIETQ